MLKRAVPSNGYIHTHKQALHHMAPTQLLFFSIILLPVLPGADAVSTVRNVAVQSGGSVTIPCHYDRKYEKHVKYWCKGYLNSCISGIRTDNQAVSGETSITDNPTHHVFTVTLTKLKTEDSGHYWCAVAIDGGVDVGTSLNLSVTADAPGLRVDQQEVTGVEGGHIIVRCHYNEPSSKNWWCRAKLYCLELNSDNSGRAEIKDDRSGNVFIVTVRELNGEDTGWYWCATGELQIPVHITVTATTLHSTSRATSLLVGTAITSGIATKPSNPKKLTVTIHRSSFPLTTTHSKSPPDLTIILMTSGILLLVVAVAGVTWKLWKKQKSVQANARAREDRRNKLASVGCEEVIYSNVFTKIQPPSYRGSPPQTQPSENPADEIMYSSVILQNPQVTPSPNQSPAGTTSDVIYTSVAQQKK